jgi:capsular polysaccharide export protein
MRHHNPPDPVEDVLSTTSGMPAPRIGVASRRMRRLAGIAALLGTEPVLAGRWNADDYDCIAGWGRKPTSLTAHALATQLRRPFITVEDGFLRSVGRGDQDPPLSIVLDDIGVYYDAGAPSRLEGLIAETLSDTQIVRTRALISAWRNAGVSKYNHARDYAGPLPKRFVLVIDQTFNDDSIRSGSADRSSFQHMLATALRDNPDCTILVKTHPDVWAGRKKGHFELAKIGRMERVQVLGVDCHPVRLLREARSVYVVTSQIGFEALIWGKSVRCFGMPFYAGWGLTQDEVAAPARRSFVSLDQLVHAALIAYPRYIEPYDGKRTDVETVLEYIGLQRRMRARFPETIHALGFSRWKRKAVRDFFNGSDLRFHGSAKRIPSSSCVAIWGNVPRQQLPTGTKVVQVEDGFLRSVGLGAELRRPLSLAIDHRGIYYDSSRPSSLEAILATVEFGEALAERARKLRERLLAERLSKYNLAAASWLRPASASRVILVPGQVESDASIRFGAPGIKTNIDLLLAVRAAAPDAYLVYKPHPDVVAGLRDIGHREDDAKNIADEVVIDASIIDIITQVDEVHTLTSLTGFEALIREKSVTCYGQPFYAGWGLTSDIVPVRRRARKLTVDQLVAGSLILYPTYVSQSDGRFATPERIIDELIARRSESASEALSVRGWQLGLRIEQLFKSLLPR